jgi:signal peptidase I
MNFNFPLILTVLTLGTGLIWLIDQIMFAPGRKARNAALQEGDLAEKEAWLTAQSKSFFPVLLIVLVMRSFWFEPFQIPSGSMIPTLLVGDFIVVNKFAYGLRLPVTNQKIIEVGLPKRGDVVIFKRPLRDGRIEDESAGLTFIKRCVGLPGDRISFVNHEFRINGELIPHSEIRGYVSEGQSIANSTSMVHSENLSGVVHETLVSSYPEPRLNGEWVVPAGHYFMMGDNRDGSSDSRDWGFVPEENLIGRASFIWFAFDSQRKGIVAWNRIGKKVH